MVKKQKKKGFKKLILTWWVWIIIALVSYLIFILIPITWTDNSLIWDDSVGLNLYKSIFAYVTQIAWIIVVCLLIFEFIKWIQKTKIGDYWKIAITILGIIGIIAYVVYSLSGWAVFKNLTYGYDERIGDSENKDLIRIHIEMLEEDGYEVLYFGDLNSFELYEEELPYVKMKSLGTRQYQVEDGLFSLSQVYPNAPEYTIRILEPTQECWYTINGTINRALNRAHLEVDGDKWNYYLENPEEYKESAVFILSQYINYQIENPTCS